MNPFKNILSINTFSSGGGFYHATTNYCGVQYTVSNDDLTLLTVYALDEDSECEWNDANMLYSYSIIDDALSIEAKHIYAALIHALMEYLYSIGHEWTISNKAFADIVNSLV